MQQVGLIQFIIVFYIFFIDCPSHILILFFILFSFRCKYFCTLYFIFFCVPVSFEVFIFITNLIFFSICIILDCYERAWKLEFEASAAAGFRLAFCYLKCRRFVEAIDVCEKVLDQYPDYPRIREEILKKAIMSIRSTAN